MKYFIVVLLFFHFNMLAQKNFKSVAKVDYEITSVAAGNFEAKGTLYFDQEQSVFMYAILGDSIANYSKTEKILENNNHAFTKQITYVDTSEKYIYKNATETIKKFKHPVTKKNIYINDSLINFDWKITADKKKIKSFECSKAEAVFKGKTYVAWFTFDIPAAYGPLEFRQLPGLILELYSTDKSLYLYATHIQYPYEEEVYLNYKEDEFITYKEYEAQLNLEHKEREERIKNNLEILQTKLGRNVKISNLKIEKTTTTPKN